MVIVIIGDVNHHYEKILSRQVVFNKKVLREKDLYCINCDLILSLPNLFYYRSPAQLYIWFSVALSL